MNTHLEAPPSLKTAYFKDGLSIFDDGKKVVSLQSHILPWWWNGRHEGLKIPWPETAVRVRFPPGARRMSFYGILFLSIAE